MKYLCHIRYVGTGFCGFQVQPEQKTVQGALCEAAAAVFGVPCKVTGCSRTDSGVHANSFFATVEPEGACGVPADRLGRAMAAYLPNDVSVMRAVLVEDSFHPRYDALGKEYLYVIDNGAVRDPFLQGRAWHLPRVIGGEQIARMNEAAAHLIGKHDFASFMAAGSSVKDTVRTVNSLSVSSKDGKIEIYISADGFLYNMVRIIVGTLTEVAFGLREPEEMKEILSDCRRASAGMTAPPDGLYLNRVFYPEAVEKAFWHE